MTSPAPVTVTAGLSLLVYAVVDAVNAGWGSTATLLRLAGAAVLLVAFVAIEQRSRDPLMPFSIFRLRTLRGANIVGLLIGMSLFSMFFFISLYLQDVMHYSPIKTGISYLPLAVGIIVSAGVASQLVNRFGFKPPLIVGLLLIAGGLIWFSQLPGAGGSYWRDILGPSLLAAVGLGFSFVPVTIAAVSGTRPHEAGLASGLINTSQQVGGALGLAILATVANSRTQSLFHAGVHTSVALTKGYDRALLFGAGFAIAGAVLAALLISSRDSRMHAKVSARGRSGRGRKLNRRQGSLARVATNPALVAERSGGGQTRGLRSGADRGGSTERAREVAAGHHQHLVDVRRPGVPAVAAGIDRPRLVGAMAFERRRHRRDLDAVGVVAPAVDEDPQRVALQGSPHRPDVVDRAVVGHHRPVGVCEHAVMGLEEIAGPDLDQAEHRVLVKADVGGAVGAGGEPGDRAFLAAGQRRVAVVDVTR